MLKYTILADDAKTDNIQVPFEVYKTVNLSGAYFHKRLLYALVDDNYSIAKNSGILVEHKLSVTSDGERADKDYEKYLEERVNGGRSAMQNAQVFSLSENIVVLDASYKAEDIERIFPSDEYRYSKINKILINALTDRFFRLHPERVYTIGSGNDAKTYVFFSDAHFFEKDEEDIYIWLNFMEGGVSVNAKMKCSWSTKNTLMFDSYIPVVCVDNNGMEVTDEGDVPTRSNAEKTIKAYLTSSESLWKLFNIMRESPFYKYNKETSVKLDKFIAYTYVPRRNITIPLSNSNEINMQQSDALTAYVNETIENSVNKITEMEKDMYHPVILHTGYNGQNPSETAIDKIEEVYKINFNFHFREHRGDDWTVEPSSYWNGTTVKDGALTLMTEPIDGAKFFEIYDTTDDNKKVLNPSRQSDLLSYLNFTDTDVRYQKNKLKKSFIRLSFYDSMNPANQNLLYYSTIFLDSGDLYGRYLKYGGLTATDKINVNGDYSSLKYDDDNKISGRVNLKGVRTNREFVYVVDKTKDTELEEHRIYREGETYQKCVKDYTGNNGGLVLVPYDGKDNIDPEKRRLSSQISVEGRNTSIASSEGFYLYLWKDNDNGIIPTDIYMKVEFNHAGLGRTIPFMMPYWDKERTTMVGVKSFQDIIDDWNIESTEKYQAEIDGETVERDDTRYNIQDFIKYSYIHFKYRYDTVNERHIYYLDDTFYAKADMEGVPTERNIYFKDNTITLNLYEAKII